ncbi:MAG TPA: cation transporter [Propionibacteriaceae bacterium]|nr:cation transporter [Propionibacteriaceae bacterium]
MDLEPVTAPTADRRRVLARRARLLAGGSVAYNIVEGLVGLTAGSVAGSAALISFGLDSAVEVASGLVILWQYRHPLPESRERLAQRLVAVCFVALAAYVTYDSVASLVTREHPGVSVVGIVLAAVSLVVMPLIAWGKRRTGRELDSSAVVADSVQTLLCTYLSAILLVGLLGNLLLGWWWLDSVAALAIAVIALREGVETWRGDED